MIFNDKQLNIINQAWYAFTKTTNVIVLLESIGLCIDDEKNAQPCDKSETKIYDLYGVQDAAINIIAEMYGINMDSEKGDSLTDILESSREDYFYYTTIPKEVHERIVNLLKE